MSRSDWWRGIKIATTKIECNLFYSSYKQYVLAPIIQTTKYVLIPAKDTASANYKQK